MVATLLIAFLKDMMLGLLTTKASDAIQGWSQQKPVQVAIDETAKALESEYVGLGGQLREWSERPDVADILLRFSRGSLPAADAADQLLKALDDVGFVPAPGGTPADQVMLWFFQKYHGALLAAEGNTYATGFLHGQVRAATEEIKSHVDAGLQRLAAGPASPALPPAVLPQLAAPASEELPDTIKNAKTLIDEGKAQAAIESLRIFEGQPGERSDYVRYELHATRGSAYLRVNQPAEAERSFRTALALRPSRGNALANVGMTRLLQKDAAGALEFAERALKLEPDNASALRLKIQALAIQEKLAEAKALAETLADGPDKSELLGFLSLKANDAQEALQHFEAAYEAKQGNPWLLGKVAHATLMVLQNRLRGTEYAPWGQLPPELRTLTDRADALLDQAIAALEKTDDWQDHAQSLFDRGGLRAFLGDARADADYSRGLELDPSNVEAHHQAAVYWIPNGQAEKAERYLGELRSQGKSTSDLDFLYARALLALRRIPEAEAVLRSIALTTPEQTKEIRLALLEAHIARKDWEGAERVLAEIPESDRSEWKVVALTAELFGAQGKGEQAVTLLRETLATVAPEHRWRLRLSLAHQLVDLEQWDDAAAEFKAILTVNSPAGLLRQYMAALFNADRLDEVLSFGQQVREARGVLPDVTEIEALAQAALGHLNASDDRYAELQKLQPDEPKWRLKRAFLAVRSGERENAARFLPKPDEIGRLGWRDGLEMAGLQSLTGDLEGSLETAFQVARTHPAEPDAQLGYVGAFFSADAVLGDSLQAHEAVPGTWVTIESGGQREVHELLKDGETPTSRVQHGNDGFAKAMLGKKAGDEVVLVDDALGKDTAKIVEIRNKYVGLFQETLTTFNRTFPQTPGLRAFSFGGAEDFEPLKRSLKQRVDHVNAVMTQYASMPMPLSMVGKALGLSDVETWEALASGEAGQPVHVGLGSPEALQKYAGLAEDTSPLALETTGIWALHRLGVLNEVARMDRKLYVAQSVLDDLEELKARREMDLRRPGDHMTLLVKGDELQRSMTSEEALRHGLQQLDTVITWVRTNCDVDGVDPGPERHRRTLLEGLSRGAYDSVLRARDTEAVLVSEDMRLRGFAEVEFQRPGLASIHLATGMLKRGLISQERFDEVMAMAAGWNYEFLSVSHTTLMAALRLDDYATGHRFQAVLRRVADPRADAGPVVVVTSEFLRNLMLHPLPQPRLQSILHAVLGALASRPDWRRLEPVLYARLDQRLQFLPVAQQTLSLEIRAWKRANLLP